VELSLGTLKISCIYRLIVTVCSAGRRRQKRLMLQFKLLYLITQTGTVKKKKDRQDHSQNSGLHRPTMTDWNREN